MSCKLKVVVSLLRIIATLLSLRPFNNYVKVIEPEGLSVGTLYFGHGGDPSHYVALRPAHMRVSENTHNM